MLRSAFALALLSTLPLRMPAQSRPPLATSDTVQRLAPEVIPGGVTFSSAVSADHRTIWFTVANYERTSLRLMQTTWNEGRWSAPLPASFAVGPRQMDPHLSPDGRTLLFSAPSAPDSAYGRARGDWDTWEVDLPHSAGARARRRPRSGNTEQHQMYPSITASGEVWVQQLPLAGSSDTIGVRGVKRVMPDGQAEMVAGLSDATNPWISPNGRLLLFSSDRDGAVGDLFVQIRNDTGTWEQAIPLGATVNSSHIEFCPSLTPDGEFLLFSRIQLVNGQRAGNDVYIVRASAVPVLREAIERSRGVRPHR